MATKKREGRRLQLGEVKESSPAGAAAGKEHDVDIVDVVEPDTPTKKIATQARTDVDNGDGTDDDYGKEDATSRCFTPRKAKRAAAATVTPSPAAKKRGALLSETPEKKKQKKASRKTTVAEELAAEEGGGGEEEPYVPMYIHENVSYTRFGLSNSNLNDGQKAAFNFIAENYVLPPDFESNRRYGPLSGLCYEERAIAAYTTNMLRAKADADRTLLKGGVCSSCGTIGHKKVRCPDLI